MANVTIAVAAKRGSVRLDPFEGMVSGCQSSPAVPLSWFSTSARNERCMSKMAAKNPKTDPAAIKPEKNPNAA